MRKELPIGLAVLTAIIMGIVSFPAFYSALRPATVTITHTQTYTERVYDCIEYATLNKLNNLIIEALHLQMYYGDVSLLTYVVNLLNGLLDDAKTSPDKYSKNYVQALIYYDLLLEASRLGRYVEAYRYYVKAVVEMDYLRITGRCV